MLALQRALQRQAATEAAPAQDQPTTSAEAAPGSAPAAGPAGDKQAAGLIVDDEAETVGAGQMRKRDFLDRLRAAVCAEADAALASAGRSTAGDPYLDRWFGYYAGQDSAHVERAIRRYAPETAGASTAEGYIQPITARVGQAMRHWAATGEITGVPEGVDLGSMGVGGLLGGVAAGVAGAVVQGVSSAVQSVGSTVADVGSAIAGGVSSAISSIGSLFGKSRVGGLHEVGDPAAIQGQLGNGQPLEGGARARMEGAFGADFTGVRLHTDATAAELSGSLNARAFTVGEHVAFASGEYRPGTLIGDALLAHELAHVVQQGPAGAQAKQIGATEYAGLEEDADTVAAGAVGALWQRAEDLLRALGRRILEGAGQAPNIIADIRGQAGMTRELAERAIRRAYGADSLSRIKVIRIIGDGFDLTVPRLPAP